MLPVVPYELEEIKNDLKRKAIEEFGLTDAEFEGSSVSQLINLLAYSTLTNNTNLTYGLNEMFISQAVDRKNVIKHARQMGYTHKRNLSYQYKIKLKTIQEGSLTVPKYSTFSSNGNDYIYLGEDILDVYGTNIFINELWNEYNNGIFNLYTNLKKNDLIVTEDGIFCKVLDKYSTGSSRILIEAIGGDLVPALSETYMQNVYVVDNSDPFNEETLHRNFIKVGTVDTFLKDKATEMFKIQVTIDPNMDFPVFTRVQLTTTISDRKFDIATMYPIKAIENIILTNPNDSTDVHEIQTEELEYIDDGNIGYDNNVLFPESTLPISETHEIDVDGTNNGIKLNDDSLDIDTEELIEELFSVDILFGGGRKQNICKDDIILKNTSHGIIIPSVETPATADGIDKVGPDNVARETVNGAEIQIGELIKTIQLVVVIDNNSNKYTVDLENIVFSNEPDTLGKVTIIDGNGNIDVNYNGYEFEVDYIKIEDLTKLNIVINYSYIKDFTNFIVNAEYIYDKNADGYLDKRFYFSDLRGEINENEQGYIEDINPFGWSGFYASDYDQETSVLYFDISKKLDTEGEPLIRPSGNFIYHNEYIYRESVGKSAINGFIEPLPISEEMVTPFRKTRFFMAEEIIEAGQDPIMVKIPNTCFGSVSTLTRKNEVEIIVKEGIIKRYNDLDEDGKILYEDLTIPINKIMADAGHFTVYAPTMEHNGIEMFVTRIMPDGSIEKDARWNQRDYLLAEHTDTNQIAEPVKTDFETDDNGLLTPTSQEEYDIALILWERHRVDGTFVAMSNLEYEDYVDIFTKYAGTGTTLSADFIVKINVINSKGAEGGTNDLISPVGLLAESFEAMPYIISSNTPHITHAEGTDIEETDSIRDNAPKFSNTANRAVTKADYKTICEAQPFISFAQVWGGEEIPKLIDANGAFIPKNFGHIYFSIIPYSKPYTFTKVQTKYTLDNLDENTLFFPRYVQITGKDSYTQVENNKKNDENVLFSVLNKYKIITLQLNYVKPIYLDIKVEINVLKYKFGQTIIETNEQIFKAARSFMIKEIEQFGSSFFKSSIIKHIDTNLGDEYGLDVDVTFSVDLYDSYSVPEDGTFTNIQMSNLATPNNWLETPEYIGQNYPGFLDAWQYEIPLAMPIEALFEDDFVSDGRIIQKGAMIIDNLTNCATDNFCVPGDKIYMLTEQNTIVAHNRDGLKEVPTGTSERVEISIIYERVLIIGNTTETQLFKVGSYVINRSEDIIILKINTHGAKHINNPAIYWEFIKDDGTEGSSNDNINYLYCPEVSLGVTEGENLMRETSLPRDYFMNITRTLNIDPKNMNIKTTKNTYPRFKSVEFIST